MWISRVDQDKTLDKEWNGMVLDIWLLAIAGAAYQWIVEIKDGDAIRCQNEGLCYCECD